MGERSALSDKVILVTGASGGIGAATVRAALEEGAYVVAHYSSNRGGAERAAALAPERCELAQADLSDPAAPLRLWNEAAGWRGGVDVLVNNAGLYEAIDFAAGADAWHSNWVRTLQVNLRSPADLMRAAIPHFVARGGGIIVNVESRAAFRGEGPMYAPYAASKGGLMSLGRTLARAYAREGVCVYGVAPGWVQTEMAAAGIREMGLDYVLRDIPLGEVAPPEEVANVIVFLASGKVRHATATTIDINGGSFPR